MKITRRQLSCLIRKALREMIEPAPSYPSFIDHFPYIPTARWNDIDLRQEFKEEVADWSGEKFGMSEEEYIKSRWPYVDVRRLDFMTDEDAFVMKASTAPIVKLPISVMKDIYNHAQVHDIITDYESGLSQQEIQDKNYNFFSQHTTDADSSGKTYNKGDSYMRWVNTFSSDLTQPFNKPPILLHANGKFMHVGGQTRQTGALSSGKVLPYLILDVN